jgi:hypothetical protein
VKDVDMSFVQNALTRLAHLTMVGVGLGLVVQSWVFLSSALDVGPELSDSAFYILMHKEYADIQSMISGFGAVLAALTNGAELQTIRLVSMIVTFTAPIVFLMVATQKLVTRQTAALMIAGILVSACASLSYYKWLLLDPSYNGMLLPGFYFCALCLWLIWDEIQHTKSIKNLTTVIFSLLLGAGVFVLCWLKISSGIVFGVVGLPAFSLALVYATNAPKRQTLMSLLCVYCLALGGAVIAIAALSARTLPFDVLWDRFLGGFEAVQLLDSHSKSLGEHLSEFLETVVDLLRVLLKKPLTILLPLALLVVLLDARWPVHEKLIQALKALALLLLTVLVVKNLDDFEFLAQAVWVFALACSFIVLTLMRIEPKYVFFAVLFAWAPYGLSFGTGSAIISHASVFTGTAITSVFFAGLATHRLCTIFVGCAVVLGTGLTLSAFDLAQRAPYRMQAPLSAATEVFVIRGETWRVPPPVAQTYKAMQEIRENEVWRVAHADVRPVLLDLSGRAPGLNWLGNFRVPALAWILSDYNGSNALLNWALNRVDADDLKNMWIAIDDPDSSGTRQGLSVAVLNEQLATVGLEFPTDYQSVGGAVPIAYMNRVAHIFAPK